MELANHIQVFDEDIETGETVTTQQKRSTKRPLAKKRKLTERPKEEILMDKAMSVLDSAKERKGEC